MNQNSRRRYAGRTICDDLRVNAITVELGCEVGGRRRLDGDAQRIVGYRGGVGDRSVGWVRPLGPCFEWFVGLVGLNRVGLGRVGFGAYVGLGKVLDGCGPGLGLGWGG